MAAIVSLGSLGCTVPAGPLSRIVESWAEQNVTSAGEPVSATLVVGAMATDLCISKDSDDWTTLEVGAPPPFEPEVLDLLGPDVVVVKSAGGPTSAFQLSLAGAQLLDRTDAEVELSSTLASGQLAVSLSLLAEAESGAIQPFGAVSIASTRACTNDDAVWAGSATWATVDGKSHSVTIGGSGDADTGLVFTPVVPFVPTRGTVEWSGLVAGEPRALTTEDAGRIDIGQDAARRAGDTGEGSGGTGSGSVFSGSARWPCRAEGLDWYLDTELLIEP